MTSESPAGPSTDLDEQTRPFDQATSNPGFDRATGFARTPIRVSLAAFTDMGARGTPPGMIGSAKVRAIHGEILDGVKLAGPRARLLELTRRPLRRSVVAVAVVALITAAAWSGIRRVPPASGQLALAAPQLEPDRVTIPTRPTPVRPAPHAPVLSSLAADSRPQPRPAHQSQACIEHRARAESARKAGEWAELEQLARQRRCWSPQRVALALQMRALFELDRYRECVDLGANSTTQEIQQWSRTCARALL